MSELRTPRVDACVFPSVRAGDDLRRYLSRPWSDHPFMGPGDFDYASAVAPFCDDFPPGALPGSDQARLIKQTVTAHDLDQVILVPRTRGLVPNTDLGSAICSATNRWLAEEWLSYSPALRGSIRVEPRDPATAVAEIKAWAGDPRFVQVAVTTQSHAPYGQRQFEAVWAAAAAHGLPVTICADGGSNGVQLGTTMVGTPPHQMQKAVLASSNFAFHLASMLAEGTFERLEDLVVVFADGGHDMLMPLMWRLNNDWRPQLSEVPWLRQAPLSYLAKHTRFVTDSFAGTTDSEQWAYWLQLSDAADLLMYGSRYPHWDHRAPDDVLAGPDAVTSAAIFGGTAASLYGLNAVTVAS